ncbi:NAD(P)/FAD-dependent oxidoreductase [Arthrobacter luteolus]|uniref:NAD(P)/FAD-dependent oxidoreductase n=1 Tax=Arthrobacter luteolus TaxID=98672 RepID=UPI00384ECD79
MTGNGGGKVDYDVVVVGGSAAGLSGALALSRARRRVAVVDAGEPRNAPASGVHNYLGREGASPAELYAVGRGEVEGYGGTIVDGTVESVLRAGDGSFRIGLQDGTELTSRRVLAASGASDELPDIPGLAAHWGTDVLHCPYCHGWEAGGKRLGVLATHLDTAVHQALMWRQWCEDIVLFLNDAGEPDTEQSRQLAARGIRVVDGAVAAVEGDAGLTGVRLASGKFVSRQALVVLTRLRARADYLSGVGLEAEEQHFGDLAVGTAVAADSSGVTSVPGIFAAGNLTAPMTQVIGAASAGLAAATAINAELIEEDTSAAVAAAAQRGGILQS